MSAPTLFDLPDAEGITIRAIAATYGEDAPAAIRAVSKSYAEDATRLKRMGEDGWAFFYGTVARELDKVADGLRGQR